MYIAQMVDNMIVGGAQKWIVTFAESLAAEDVAGEHRLTVIGLGVEVTPGLVAALEALSVQFENFPSEKLITPGRFLRLVRYFQTEKFDLIQTHLTRANILGILAGIWTGIPVIAMLHSTGEAAHRYNPRRTQLETFLLRHFAKKVLAVGHAVADAHAHRLGARATHVIQNAVAPGVKLSPSRRNQIRRLIAGETSRPILISVGRISAPKGYDDLLRAMTALRTTHPEALSVIVGQGSLYQNIADQIEVQGLSKHVVLLGERGDVPHLLAAADIFVSTSHREGLPLAILEAMSAGLPIVATRVGDVPQVLGDGRGRVVPPHQPRQIARALTNFLDHPQEMASHARAAQAYIADNHHPRAWIRQLLSVYQDVLQ